MADGATEILLPVPAEVPPQLPLYHLQVAPVPRLPPLIVRVVVFPLHMVVLPLTELAGVDVS